MILEVFIINLLYNCCEIYIIYIFNVYVILIFVSVRRFEYEFLMLFLFKNVVK